MPVTDLQWIQQLMRRHEGGLVSYAIRLTGNVDTARDVVQDTFFRLCEADRAAMEAHAAAWLYRVCRNRALDIKRKGKPMRQASEAQLATCKSAEPSPAAVAQKRQAMSQVQEHMEQLSHKQQEVLRLKFQHELSYREIARVTGQSVTNVGYLIHTAISKLRELMEAAPAPARRTP